MIAVTAVGWAVTFIISLVFILTKFDSKMLLLQDKGTSTETCGSNGEGMLSILQCPGKSAAYFHEIVEEKYQNVYHTVIKSDIFQSDLVQMGKYIVINIVNYSVLLFNQYQSLDVMYQRMLLSMAFSCCLLFLLLNCVDMTANGNQSCEPSVVSTETANNSSLQINGVDTNANASSQVNQESARPTVSAVQSVYNRVFRALEKSNFFSKLQCDMSIHTITGTPRLLDVQTMLDPLFMALHEGVENLAILSQEYMKQNSQLMAAEKVVRTSEFTGADIENEEELTASVSSKDAEIAELNEKVENLLEDVDQFINNTSQIHSEMKSLSEQLENQNSKADTATKLYRSAMVEAEDVQQSIEDEVKAERDLNEAVIKDYAKNVQTVLKMLLQLSKCGEPTFVSVEDFLLSDTFRDFLKLGDYPAELEAVKLFQEHSGQGDTYDQHLRILKRKY